MRQRNMRLVLTGSAMIALAVVFFLFFLSIASKSNDPSELMRTVGTTSGVVAVIGLAFLLAGWVGKKT